MPTREQRPVYIARIRALPGELEAAANGLSEAQLDFTPAPGEWSIRQIVHHLADAHLNAMMRMKLALTEDRPTIKPYDQNRLAELADSAAAPVAVSLMILRGLHERWALLMESLDDDQWARPFMHPERGEQTVAELLDYYAGHGEVHLQQIAQNKAAMGEQSAAEAGE